MIKMTSCCGFVFVLLTLIFSRCLADDLVSTPDLEIVKEGDFNLVPAIDDIQARQMTQALESTPANIPKNLGHDIKSLWSHLNRRLREAKSGYKVVFETNLPPDRIKEEYLNKKATRFDGRDWSDAEMDQLLAKMSCKELFALILYNTNTVYVPRKGVLFLVHDEQAGLKDDLDRFLASPKQK